MIDCLVISKAFLFTVESTVYGIIKKNSTGLATDQNLTNFTIFKVGDINIYSNLKITSRIVSMLPRLLCDRLILVPAKVVFRLHRETLLGERTSPGRAGAAATVQVLVLPHARPGFERGTELFGRKPSRTGVNHVVRSLFDYRAILYFRVKIESF